MPVLISNCWVEQLNLSNLKQHFSRNSGILDFEIVRKFTLDNLVKYFHTVEYKERPHIADAYAFLFFSTNNFISLPISPKMLISAENAQYCRFFSARLLTILGLSMKSTLGYPVLNLFSIFFK